MGKMIMSSKVSHSNWSRELRINTAVKAAANYPFGLNIPWRLKRLSVNDVILR